MKDQNTLWFSNFASFVTFWTPRWKFFKRQWNIKEYINDKLQCYFVANIQGMLHNHIVIVQAQLINLKLQLKLHL